jgi:hypothetical protein
LKVTKCPDREITFVGKIDYHSKKRDCRMTKKTRTNVINLSSVSAKNSKIPRTLARNIQDNEVTGPGRDIARMILGSRLVGGKNSEIWHLEGVLAGDPWETVPLGEFSVSRIPKMSQPSHAVVGYLTPPEGYQMSFGLDELWNQFKGIMAHLGYDIEGYYGSLSLMGQPVYFEEFEADLEDE